MNSLPHFSPVVVAGDKTEEASSREAIGASASECCRRSCWHGTAEAAAFASASAATSAICAWVCKDADRSARTAGIASDSSHITVAATAASSVFDTTAFVAAVLSFAAAATGGGVISCQYVSDFSASSGMNLGSLCLTGH